MATLQTLGGTIVGVGTTGGLNVVADAAFITSVFGSIFNSGNLSSPQPLDLTPINNLNLPDLMKDFILFKIGDLRNVPNPNVVQQIYVPYNVSFWETLPTWQKIQQDINNYQAQCSQFGISNVNNVFPSSFGFSNSELQRLLILYYGQTANSVVIPIITSPNNSVSVQTLGSPIANVNSDIPIVAVASAKLFGLF